MSATTLGQRYLKELESEAKATRACLERIPENLFEYKPTEKSMSMVRLAYTVSDIPRWIAYGVNPGEVDFATYPQFSPKTTADLVSHFEETMADAKKVLETVSDEDLQETFSLKNQGQVLYSMPKWESVESSINHLVHHRGQLTVYMRMNSIPIPSIYGPSGDDQSW